MNIGRVQAVRKDNFIDDKMVKEMRDLNWIDYQREIGIHLGLWQKNCGGEEENLSLLMEVFIQ